MSNSRCVCALLNKTSKIVLCFEWKQSSRITKKVGYIRCVVIYSLSTGENIKNNKNRLITKNSYCANFTW